MRVQKRQAALRQAQSRPCTKWRVGPAGMLAILWLLPVPCAMAQTRHSSSTNLRLSVTVVPVTFSRSTDHLTGTAWVDGLPGSVLLSSSPAPSSVALAEEVKKLSDTGWKVDLSSAMLLPARVGSDFAARHAAFSRRGQELGSALRSVIVASGEAMLRTCIVVPQ